MLKRPLAALAAVSVLSLVGCARMASNEAPVEAPVTDDVLFLRTSTGITLINAVSEAPAVSLTNAVPSTDWSAVVQADSQGGQTLIQAFDSSSGDQLWSRDTPGNLEVKVASEDGRMVALGTPLEGSTGYPVGRSFTELVIIDQDTAEPRKIKLEGNYEPEAFSTDGASLFVIEYLPPRAPTRYRVRRLDLGTEQVGGVYTVDAELQEAMQGTARVQAASPDGGRLYTLYSLEGAYGIQRAFVHVLSLDEQWAHCVDLPASFGNASEHAIALSVAPDGRRLYVADASAGAVAEVDTEALTVARSAEVAFGSSRAPAHAVRGRDGMLYLGSGTRLLAVDASTLTPARSWDMRSRITGIQAAGDGRRLYVGLKDQIVILDTATGERLGEIRPAQIGTIDQLGQSTRPLDEERSEILCAC